MTDKQLALLIRQIAARVRGLAAEIEPLIDSGELITTREVDMSSWQAVRTGEMIESIQLAAVKRVLDLALDLEDEDSVTLFL